MAQLRLDNVNISSIIVELHDETPAQSALCWTAKTHTFIDSLLVVFFCRLLFAVAGAVHRH